MRKRDTSRNKTSLNCACFAHDLFIVSLSMWGWNGRMGPIHSWGPTKICETNL